MSSSFSCDCIIVSFVFQLETRVNQVVSVACVAAFAFKRGTCGVQVQVLGYLYFCIFEFTFRFDFIKMVHSSSFVYVSFLANGPSKSIVRHTSSIQLVRACLVARMRPNLAHGMQNFGVWMPVQQLGSGCAHAKAASRPG